MLEALRASFRPAFLNRVDEVLIFHGLGREQIAEIVAIQLRGLRARLAERKIELALTPQAKRWLAAEGYDPVYGARPLKRVIQRMGSPAGHGAARARWQVDVLVGQHTYRFGSVGRGSV